MTHLTDRDLEQLSAYLDGELRPAEAAEVETRLQVEPELARTLAELRWMTAGLRRLPRLRPPRRYRLTPEMVGQRGGQWGRPALRLATAVMTLALVAVIGLDFVGTAARFSMAGAPQALEAPAAAPAEQAMADKAEQDAQPSLEGRLVKSRALPWPTRCGRRRRLRGLTRVQRK